MTCDGARDLIDRFLAGTVSVAEREAFEQHVGACADCREDLASARVLRPAVSALPRSLEPPRDLWPAITRRLEPRRALPSQAKAWRWRRPALTAAAAVLLVAGSSAATLWLTRGQAPRMAAMTTPAIEAGYVNATADLMRALDAERDRLAPATVATLERNLAVIDAAIAESRAALAADPGNRDLAALLWASYRQKVALLQQASRLAERS